MDIIKIEQLLRAKIILEELSKIDFSSNEASRIVIQELKYTIKDIEDEVHKMALPFSDFEPKIELEDLKEYYEPFDIISSYEELVLDDKKAVDNFFCELESRFMNEYRKDEDESWKYEQHDFSWLGMNIKLEMSYDDYITQM